MVGIQGSYCRKTCGGMTMRVPWDLELNSK